MKFHSVLCQHLIPILIGAVIGFVAALATGLSVFKLLSHPLHEQLGILLFLWCTAGVLVSLLITRLPAPLRSHLLLTDLTTGHILRKIFLAVFSLFPIGLIVYQQIAEVFQIFRKGQSSDLIGWLPPGTTTRTFLILALAVGGLLLMIMFRVSRKQQVRTYIETLPSVYYSFFIILLSLSLRLPLIYFIDTQPVSDFANINADALLVSQGRAPVNFYAATHVAVTMIYGFLYRVFGSSLSVIKIFHAAVYGLAGVFLYYAGKRSFGSKLWACMAAVLLVGWPSLALYSNVPTPEHLFILVECVLVFMVAHILGAPVNKEDSVRSRSGTKETILFTVTGLLVGLSGLFRPFSLLFFVALVLTLVIYQPNRKRLAVNLLCMSLSVWLIGKIPFAVMNYYHDELQANVRPCNFLVGMNFESAGQYNPQDVDLCARLREEAPDEAAFTNSVVRAVWERWQIQKDGLLLFIDKKFGILWRNSNETLFWTVRSIESEDQNRILNIVQRLSLTDIAATFIVTIACLIGTLIAFFKDVKPVIFFCLLSFFGFNLMEIPLEIQTRYRTVMMPLLIFFACWTLAVIYSTMKNNPPLQEQGGPSN